MLPIYNEAASIAHVIEEIRRALWGYRYRIIALDDGSTDRTPHILKDLTEKKKDVVTLRTPVNMGIGAVFSVGISYVLGVSKSGEDILIIMESDQTSTTSTIRQLSARVGSGFDVVIASRYCPGGGYGNFPLGRRLFSYSANILMRLFFPLPKVADYTIFFRGYRVGILKRAGEVYGRFGLIQSKGFVANAELLVKLALVGARIGEIPFVYDYGTKQGGSKLSIVQTVNEYIVTLLYLRQVRGKVSALARRS
ncbi:MAG: Glycosyl transferase [Microgenomates group bacterium GW2011_GWA2_47_8]|nr:MAG: Glycosyl transferase [Microgenomates group bacterium GW2011_GWA2_47_8]